jgi:hypothetical protein
LLELIDASASSAREAATGLLGAPPDSFEQLQGGRNSRLYRVTQGGRAYALKQYVRVPGDDRDRLRTEFEALSFLRDAGIARVPAAIARDTAADCALYEFVVGTPVVPASVTDGDIDAVVELLAALRRTSQSPGCAWTAPASEARFSIADVLANIDVRLVRLRGALRVGDSGRRFDEFLEHRLEAAVAEIGAWARRVASAPSIGVDREITRSERTLSPSDVGFHNAVRDRDGRLVFVDFEYFGWDDPAKTLCDFLLHPAMQLTAEHKVRLTRGMLAAMDLAQLPQRTAVLFPLFGLKWITIVLNEFLPEHLARRDFSAGSGPTHEERRIAQLDKATALLDRTLTTVDAFPYA